MPKILYINDNPKPNGCTMYRNIIPAEGLESIGWKPHFLPIPEDQFDFDIVVFSRMYQYEGIKPIVDMIRKKTKAKIVYDTDDLIDHISPDNPFRAELHKEELLKSYWFFLKEADLVTVTTEYLKEEVIKKRGAEKPTVVLPNSVREFNFRDGKEKKVRICYTGSTTHFPDYDFVLDVILDLQKKYDFEFVTLGLGQDDFFEDRYKHNATIMRPYLSCMEKIKQLKNYTLYEPVGIFDYQDTLRDMNITIGICPLHDDNFTRCKSAVKYYDFASVGTATLAQKSVVYEDCNFTAKYRFSDWKTKLEMLISDEKTRETLLKQQIEYVAKNRHIDIVKYQWDKEYRKLLK